MVVGADDKEFVVPCQEGVQLGAGFFVRVTFDADVVIIAIWRTDRARKYHYQVLFRNGCRRR